MVEYDKHIEYSEDVLRPYLVESGVEVHKIEDQLEKGKSPQNIVDDFNRFGETDSEVISHTEVETVMHFSKDYSETVQDIIREQNTLIEAIDQQPEEVDNLDLEYFEVEVNQVEDDGEQRVEFEYEQRP